MHDYAVWDLETTGLTPGVDAITEIGWMIVKGGIPGPVRSLLVRCDQPVPAEVVHLTGISTALLAAEGSPLADVLDTFLYAARGLPLVGHNIVRFDALFLEAACASVGLTPPDRDRYVDTAALYKARRLGRTRAVSCSHWDFATAVLALRTPGLRYNLAACCDALGIGRDGALHRAAADVQATQAVYAALSAPVGALPT